MRTPTLCRTMQAFGYKEVTEDTMASWARKLLMGATLMVGAVFCLTAALPALAAGNTLESVSFASLTGEQIQLSLRFRSTPSKPSTFSIDNPARIALDFPDTTAQVNERSRDINIGVARSVHTVTANDRTRVVIELAKLVNYRTEVVGNEVLVTLGGGANIATAATQPTPYAASSLIQPVAGNGITNVDFRRGESGAGRILIGLTQPDIPIDLRVQAGEILIDFADTALPDELRRRLDVVDFATPVQSIDAFQSGNNVRMVIDAAPKSEHMAYQSGNLYTVEVQPIVEDEQGVRGSDEYTGERLSLNFQDIEIRSVLQLIADFTGLNIVVSDGVAGNLTLRLKNVPWDQALDIILKTKGLDVRRTGNVMLVAPAEEIAAREKLELEAQQQVSELAPVSSEFVQINYARAADIAALLKAPENSLLSERGNVSVDTRTNALLVQDTAAKLGEVRRLVDRLDIPVRQVLIESRIVIASDNFSKELGVRFGASSLDDDGSTSTAVSGSLDGASQLINDDDLQLNDRLNVNLPVANPAGSIGIALAKLPFGTLLELELSAAQAESRAEIVSTPKVITSNQNTARIEQGVEIPYQTGGGVGTAPTTEFKKAVLSLNVTPQITPDDRIIMDLAVSNDTVGQLVPSGLGGTQPSIDTRSVETQVLVDNGQTVVLGGVYEQRQTRSASRVPFLSDIPLLGRLFRSDRNSSDKAELLIFVTPRVISDSLWLAR
ncbi:MAG: type IV pilus secretin PilQ [Gammaproteobacteria bacterium]